MVSCDMQQKTTVEKKNEQLFSVEFVERLCVWTVLCLEREEIEVRYWG